MLHLYSITNFIIIIIYIDIIALILLVFLDLLTRIDPRKGTVFHVFLRNPTRFQ